MSTVHDFFELKTGFYIGNEPRIEILRILIEFI